MSQQRNKSNGTFLFLLFGLGFCLMVGIIAYNSGYISAPSNPRISELETRVAQLSSENATLQPTATAQAPTAQAITATPAPSVPTLIVVAGAANVRAGPSTTYEVIETVLKDQLLRGPYSTQQGWHQVCCVDGGKRGWISGELVKERDPSLAIAPPNATRTPFPTRLPTLAPIATPSTTIQKPILITSIPPTTVSSDRCMNQLRSGQYQKAVDCYDGRIDLFSREPTDYLNRGVARSYLGHYEAAIQDYNQVIKLDPTEACAFRNRGISRNRLGQTQAAYTDFTEAIRIRPSYDGAYTSRGLLLLQEFKQYQSAVTDFDKAISLKSSSLTGSAPRMCMPTPEPNPTAGPSPTPHLCPNNCYVDDESRYIATYLGRAYAYYHLGHRQQSLSDAETALALSRKYGDKTSETSAINLINALR